MQKYVKEPKSKKVNQQNKLKKALYPKTTKPITLETYIGLNNQKVQTRKNINKKKNHKKEVQSPSRKLKNRNTQEKSYTNRSQNNNTFLELDYLNFSRIDIGLRKLNSSFDEDMFNSKIFIKEKKELVSNRYNGIESSSIDNSKNDTNINLNSNKKDDNYIKESKEKLLKTPSTLCNYYGDSEAPTSQKKNSEKNELRKNLNKLHEESKNDEIDYITVNKRQNIVNWKLKDSIKILKNKEKEKEEKTLNENKKELDKLILDIKKDFAKNQSQKQKQKSKNNNNINNNNYYSEIPYKNNLMKNYLNSNINKRKNSYNMSSSKKNDIFKNMNNIPKEITKTLKYTNNNSTKSFHIQNNTTCMNTNNLKNTNIINNTQDINSLIKTNFNNTVVEIMSAQNMVNKQYNNKKANNTTNGIYYINSTNKNYKQSSKHYGQKPIILCYDQMKYDSYFVTPKNTKKITKGKVLTSNKSNKIENNSGNTNWTTNNKNNSNNNNLKKNNNNNYNIVVNTLLKTKNKSFNKNINNKNIEYNKYYTNLNPKFLNNTNTIERRKLNLKTNNKSSSILIRQNGHLPKKIKSNSSMNTILKLLNSGAKKNSQLLQDLLSKVSYSNSNTKSPLKKYKSNNTLKISKTLTEHNILNRMQVTPKYNKIPKSGNAFTTMIKRNIYIGSNCKSKNGTEKHKIKYHNSSVKKNNNQFFGSNNNYKDILGNLFNHKTQSDFKTNKYFLLNNSNINNNENNEYGLDKHIKQKLLDRMNKATNNWNYVFKANNKNVKNNKNSNKKILIENLSEIMMSPDKNDFINNNTIISDESEDEKDKNNS